MIRETSLGGSNLRFPQTLWTSVLRAQQGEDRCRALDGLLRVYWKPVYFYVRRRGHSVEDAKDLTQEFFTLFVEKEFLRSVSREKGRFRTFVLAALDHFLAKDYRRGAAQKRGGGRTILSLDFVEAEERLPAGTAEQVFDREWGLSVLERGLGLLRAESDPKEFDVLSPCLTRGTRHYDDLAAKLACDKKAVARKMYTLRKRLRSLVEAAVRETVGTAEDWTEEMKNLANILENRA